MRSPAGTLASTGEARTLSAARAARTAAMRPGRWSGGTACEPAGEVENSACDEVWIVEHWHVAKTGQGDELGAGDRGREPRGCQRTKHEVDRSVGDADRHPNAAQACGDARADARPECRLKSRRASELMQVALPFRRRHPPWPAAKAAEEDRARDR